MYKNLLYTGLRNNKQEVSKQYKTYKDNWSPECNHNTDIVLCCTANNYMMNNILRNKITSNTKKNHLIHYRGEKTRATEKWLYVHS